MLLAISRQRIAMVAGRVALTVALAVLAASVRGADPAAGAAGDAATGEMLTPCLAIAADGTPVWPSTTFPPSRRLTVAFRLAPDHTAKTLRSTWVVITPDGDKPINDHTLDLKGMKIGTLRLDLKKPIPPGRYRVDVQLDEQPWRSAEIEITPPLDGGATKPADLIPLTEGMEKTYDLVTRTGPGTKMDIPGGKKAPDGSIISQVAVRYGTRDDVGTEVQASVNGSSAPPSRVRLDDDGVKVVRRGNEPVDPPELSHPLPPTLADVTEWTAPASGGGKQRLYLFGPLPLTGPGGATKPGYVIFSQEQTNVGEPGTSSVRGFETLERHYIPGFGLVREIRVSTLGGKLTSRHDLALAGTSGGSALAAAPAGGGGGGAGAAPATMAAGGAPTTSPAGSAAATGAYRLEPDPQMKGRLGRVKFVFPPDAKSGDARVAVHKPGEQKQIAGGYGEQTVELMPGKYEAVINGKRVPVEVKSGHVTIPHCGVLRVHAGGDTSLKVLDADGKTQLFGGYGSNDVALPPGTYTIQIAGGSEPVTIEDGKVTEF